MAIKGAILKFPNVWEVTTSKVSYPKGSIHEHPIPTNPKYIGNGTVTSKHTTIWSPEKQSFLYNYADELHPPVRSDAHFAQSEPHIMPMPDVLGPKAR